MTEAKSLRAKTTGTAGTDGAAPEEGRRGGGTRSLGQVLPRLTRSVLGRQGFAAADILLEWTVIAGTELARICRPDKLSFPRGRRNGATLHLRVASASATELLHEGPRLIERVNRYFGYAAVERLKLVHAPLGNDRKSAASPRARPTRRVEAGELAALRQQLATIEDAELRETLERLGASVLAESRKKPES